MSDIISKIDLRFSSGNDVPVTRAHITDSEWEILRGEIDRLRAELDAAKAQMKRRDDIINEHGAYIVDLNAEVNGYRNQSPAAWIRGDKAMTLDTLSDHDIADPSDLVSHGWEPLYAAPVPPAAVAVPDELTKHPDGMASQQFVDGWNACREAILSAKKHEVAP